MATEPGAPRSGIQWQTAVIRRIVQQTPRAKSFFLELSKPFGFIAGQHVDIRLTAPDGYQAQRSYSIASAPEYPGPLEITIDRLDDGEVSPFFHDVAAVGDEIEMRGPFGGYFIWSAKSRAVPSPSALSRGAANPVSAAPTEESVLLVGGGSGVVPLMSILRHRAARQSRTPMLLLFSARTWDDVIFRDELIALADRHDGFELAITLTREAARRPIDYARRIDRQLAGEALGRLPASPTIAFVCGSNPFVEAAATSLIAAGVPERIIRTERYGG